MDNSTNETGFLIERSTGDGYAGIGSTRADATNYTDSAVSPGIVYYYQVVATNLTTRSPPSASASAAVDNQPPTVNAGTNQTVTLSGSASWTPAEISTMAWYDAMDESTLTIVDGKVSEWPLTRMERRRRSILMSSLRFFQVRA